MSRQKTNTLTELDQLVMALLWDSDENLTINEMTEKLQYITTDISVASVAQIVKRLLDKKMIRVEEHKLVSNVYARTFAAVMTREDYMKSELNRLQRLVSFSKRFGKVGVLQAFLGTMESENLSQKDIEELEALVEQSKKILRKGK